MQLHHCHCHCRRRRRLRCRPSGSSKLGVPPCKASMGARKSEIEKEGAKRGNVVTAAVVFVVCPTYESWSLERRKRNHRRGVYRKLGLSVLEMCQFCLVYHGGIYSTPWATLTTGRPTSVAPKTWLSCRLAEKSFN